MTKQTAKLWNRQKNFVKVAHIAFGSYFRKKTTTHFHMFYKQLQERPVMKTVSNSKIIQGPAIFSLVDRFYLNWPEKYLFNSVIMSEKVG